jgi:hypothetical protein
MPSLREVYPMPERDVHVLYIALRDWPMSFTLNPSERAWAKDDIGRQVSSCRKLQWTRHAFLQAARGELCCLACWRVSCRPQNWAPGEGASPIAPKARSVTQRRDPLRSPNPDSCGRRTCCIEKQTFDDPSLQCTSTRPGRSTLSISAASVSVAECVQVFIVNTNVHAVDKKMIERSVVHLDEIPMLNSRTSFGPSISSVSIGGFR